MVFERDEITLTVQPVKKQRKPHVEAASKFHTYRCLAMVIAKVNSQSQVYSPWTSKHRLFSGKYHAYFGLTRALSRAWVLSSISFLR